jgi:transcriptional regulator with XRE-family HTH domain
MSTHFGPAFRAARESVGVSISQLVVNPRFAKAMMWKVKLDVNENPAFNYRRAKEGALQQLENGKRKPSAGLAGRIARGLCALGAPDSVHWRFAEAMTRDNLESQRTTVEGTTIAIVGLYLKAEERFAAGPAPDFNSMAPGERARALADWLNAPPPSAPRDSGWVRLVGTQTAGGKR